MVRYFAGAGKKKVYEATGRSRRRTSFPGSKVRSTFGSCRSGLGQFAFAVPMLLHNVGMIIREHNSS